MDPSNHSCLTAFNFRYEGAASFLLEQQAIRGRRESVNETEPAPVAEEKRVPIAELKPLSSQQALKIEALVRFKEVCNHTHLNCDQIVHHWNALITKSILTPNEFNETANRVFQILMQKSFNQEVSADVVLLNFINRKEVKSRIKDRRHWIGENLDAMTPKMNLAQAAQFVNSHAADPSYKLLILKLEERRVFLERSVTAIIDKVSSTPTDAGWKELIEQLRTHRYTNLQIWSRIWNLPNNNEALSIALEIARIDSQFLFHALSSFNIHLFDHLCANDKMIEWIGSFIDHLSRTKVRGDEETRIYEKILKTFEKRLFSSHDIKKDIAVYLQTSIILLGRRPILSSKYFQGCFFDLMKKSILPHISKADPNLVDFCAGVISQLLPDKNGKWALNVFMLAPELFVQDTDHQNYLIQQILENESVNHAEIADKLAVQNDPLADAVALKLYAASDVPSAPNKAVHLLIRNQVVNQEQWRDLFRKSISETSLTLIADYLLGLWSSNFPAFYSILSLMRDSQILNLLKTSKVERFVKGEVSEYGALGRVYYLFISRGISEVENQVNAKKAHGEDLGTLAIDVLKVHEKIAESGSNAMKLESQNARTRLLKYIFKNKSFHLTDEDARFCFDILTKYYQGRPDMCLKLSQFIQVTEDFGLILSSLKILKDKGENLDFGRLFKIKGLTKEQLGQIFELLEGYRIKITKKNITITSDLQRLLSLALSKKMYEESLNFWCYLITKDISIDVRNIFRNLPYDQKSIFIENLSDRIHQKYQEENHVESENLLKFVSEILNGSTEENINYIPSKLLRVIEEINEDRLVPIQLIKQISRFYFTNRSQNPKEKYLTALKFMLRWGDRLKEADINIYNYLGNEIIKIQRKVIVRAHPSKPTDPELWKGVTDFIFFCTKDTKKLCPIHDLGTEESWLGHSVSSMKNLFQGDYPQEDAGRLLKYFDDFKDWEAIERGCLTIFSDIPELRLRYSSEYVKRWKEGTIDNRFLLTRLDLLFRANPSIEIWEDLLSEDSKIFANNDTALLFLRHLKIDFTLLSEDIERAFQILNLCLEKAMYYCESHRKFPEWATMVFHLHEIYLKTHDERSVNINSKLCLLIPKYIKLANLIQKSVLKFNESSLILFESIHGMIASCRQGKEKACDLTTYLDYCLMYLKSLDEIIKNKDQISEGAYRKCQELLLSSCKLLSHGELQSGTQLSEIENEKLARCRLFWMNSYH